MKQTQDLVKTFVHRHKLEMPPEHALLDLLSEAGEVAKELLKASSYGRTEYKQNSTSLAEELGDVLYSLCVVANTCDIDLQTALVRVLTKMERRLVLSGSAGSGSQTAS